MAASLVDGAAEVLPERSVELEELEPLLGAGARTLKRDWRVARAFLPALLKDEDG